MYNKDWISGAERLREKALEYMRSYENLIYIEDYFSEEFCIEECEYQLNDYAQQLIASDYLDEESKFFAVAVIFGIVDHEDSDMDYVFDINISKFEVLEAIVNSYVYQNSQMNMSNWTEENQVLLIIDLVKVYFSTDRQRVLDIWDQLPWCSIDENVLDIFAENMLDVFSNLFEGSDVNDDAIRLIIKLN